jgi:hypothetical protein
MRIRFLQAKETAWKSNAPDARRSIARMPLSATNAARRWQLGIIPLSPKLVGVRKNRSTQPTIHTFIL